MSMHYILFLLSVWIKVACSEVPQDSHFYEMANVYANHPAYFRQPLPSYLPSQNRLFYGVKYSKMTVTYSSTCTVYTSAVCSSTSSSTSSSSTTSTTSTTSTESSTSSSASSRRKKRSINDVKDILLIQPSLVNKMETTASYPDIDSIARGQREANPQFGFWRDSFDGSAHYEPQPTLSGIDHRFYSPHVNGINQRRPIIPADPRLDLTGLLNTIGNIPSNLLSLVGLGNIIPLVQPWNMGVTWTTTVSKIITSTPSCSSSSGYNACS